MEENFIKDLENKIGKEDLMKFADIMTEILAKQGDKRALIFIQIEKICDNIHKLGENAIRMNKEKEGKKLEETENFCIQINKIIEDYMKEN